MQIGHSAYKLLYTRLFHPPSHVPRPTCTCVRTEMHCSLCVKPEGAACTSTESVRVKMEDSRKRDEMVRKGTKGEYERSGKRKEVGESTKEMGVEG